MNDKLPAKDKYRCEDCGRQWIGIPGDTCGFCGGAIGEITDRGDIPWKD